MNTYPWEFIWGLVHSDGCRITNWTTRLVGGERKGYEYPRYWFTNVSDDIRKLYTDTLEKLGVEWKHCARNGNPFKHLRRPPRVRRAHGRPCRPQVLSSEALDMKVGLRRTCRAADGGSIPPRCGGRARGSLCPARPAVSLR